MDYVKYDMMNIIYSAELMSGDKNMLSKIQYKHNVAITSSRTS